MLAMPAQRVCKNKKILFVDGASAAWNFHQAPGSEEFSTPGDAGDSGAGALLDCWTRRQARPGFA
jgi:hypothetical protein